MGIKKFINNVKNNSGVKGAVNFAFGNAEQMAADANISFFECTKMDNDTIMMPATKVQRNVGTKGGVANSKGTPNLIANGSVFNVGVKQAAILIENGRVHDCIVAMNNEDAGQYTYQSDAAPSWLNYLNIGEGGMLEESKSCGQKIKDALGNFANEYKMRMMAGGQSTNSMYLVYLNLQPVLSIKVGKGDIMLADRTIGRTIKMGCNGTVLFQVLNPVFFFENFVRDYTKPITVKDEEANVIIKSLKDSFATNLAPMVKMSAQQGYGWQDFTDNSGIIGNAAIDLLGEQIFTQFGLGLYKADFFVNIDEKLMERLLELEDKRDVGNDAAVMRTMAMEGGMRAMNTAAGNSGGTMVGMYGMNAMMNASQNMMGGMGMAPQQAQFGGLNQAQMMQQPMMQQPMSGNNLADQLRARRGQQKPAENTAASNNTAPNNTAPSAEGWTCECGATNITSKFCPECGKPKPAPKPAAEGWNCECGATGITSKFCPECGKPKPEAPAGWNCSCGATGITSKFCPECGSPKPAEAPKKKTYKCDKCGWVPADPTKPPRFCPECGDVFDVNDAE